MKKIKNTPEKSCLFWHRWKLEKTIEYAKYHECVDCGARFVQWPKNVYQEIDYDWVVGGKK